MVLRDSGLVSEDERINIIKEEFRDATKTPSSINPSEATDHSPSSGNDGESSTTGKK